MKRIFCSILFIYVVALANAKQPEPPVPGAVVFNTCGAQYGIYFDNFMADIQKVPFNIYIHSRKNNKWEKRNKGSFKITQAAVPDIDDGKLVVMNPYTWMSYDYFAIEILPVKLLDVYKEVEEGAEETKRRATFRLSISGIVGMAKAEEEFLRKTDLNSVVSLDEEVVLDFDYEIDNYARFVGGQKDAYTLLFKNARIRNGEKNSSTVSCFRKPVKFILDKFDYNSTVEIQNATVFQIVLKNPNKGSEYKFSGYDKKEKQWIDFACAQASDDNELILVEKIPFGDMRKGICFIFEKDGETCNASYEVDSADKKIIFTIED